jgi:signal transduction histidine kinase/ActR/RegA family two-component response regulator
MRNSPGRSIRSKVMLVVLATTVAALFVVAIALIVYESRTYERSTAEGLMTQAQILARTTAPALVFDDPAAARDNLALLKVQPQILAAAIYMKGGRLFASYGNAELFGIVSTRTPPAADGYTIEGGEIVVFRRITEDREFLGTVYLRARYDLDARLRDYLSILGVVLIASLALTLLLSATLQRAITQPILDVTAVARQVIERRDFSLRVEKTTHDEIGYLVDAFNGMLAEVGRRAEALEASNATLSRESAERRDAEEALRVADRRKDEFLAMLAHELRNPLAPLRNALEILKHADGNPRAAAEARQMMERQLRQMVRLVDDLLDVSRITTGKLALKTEVCDLHDIIRNAVDTAQPLIDARGHSLSVVEPDETVRIHGDPTRLAQVFANLLNNAANYTEPGGRIELVAVADAQTVTISVIDNGIGIAREMLQPVFQMFAQADESLERVHGGLGVGLTLARHLVELHSGTIDAHSEGIGRGSTFIVRLPRTFATPAQTSERRRSETRTSTMQRRVLIADDNVDFAMSLEAILDELVHDVRVTHVGLAAIAAAEEFAPEIAFIDIGLPGRDGYSVARALRELPATASSTLVAVTGWGQDDDRRRSLDAGFGIHLVKPVEPQQIIDVVNAAAPARAAV